MADYKATAAQLASIANAIRIKGGTSAALIYPSGWISAIENLTPASGGSEITPADPNAEYKVTDTELTSIANAIRTRGGTSVQLEFPTEFVAAINAITGGVLPSGYTQVVGIHSNDRSNYINLGILPTSDIYVKASCSRVKVDDLRTFLGSRESVTSKCFMLSSDTSLRINNIKQTAECRIFNSTSNGSVQRSVITNEDILYFDINVASSTYKINNIDCTPNSRFDGTQFIGNNFPLFLFASNNGGTPGSYYDGTIYSFEIGNSNGKVMELIPCVRDADSEAGFYDIVGDQFFSNDGNGTLTAVTQ